MKDILYHMYSLNKHNFETNFKLKRLLILITSTLIKYYRFHFKVTKSQNIFNDVVLS